MRTTARPEEPSPGLGVAGMIDAMSSEPNHPLDGLLDQATRLQPHTVALRRRIHQHPEVGLRLPTTQRVVLDALRELDLSVHTGTGLDSVVAVLTGDRPGPTTLLRGDLDALPLTEDTGLPYASTVDGVMHACGHDTHTAMLVSAARLLSARKSELAGRVVFMFQPGEEGFHGARLMLDEGVLDAAGTPVDRAFALHITSTLPSGLVQCRPGPAMASADAFRVTVTGRGGHAAAPHDTLDPVQPAAAIVGALYAMTTRRISPLDPVVLTVARLTAGTTSNVIPRTAELEGTIRTTSESTRATMLDELARVCTHTALAHGCTAEVHVQHGYPALVNDERIAESVLALADRVLGAKYWESMTEPIMSAEDFSYVLQRVPGAMAFLGACPPDVELAAAEANHSNRVRFDESALPHGVALYAAFALDTAADSGATRRP